MPNVNSWKLDDHVYPETTEQREIFSKNIDGTDGKSWVLPLPFDDPIQPLYRGLPLPLCVLEAAGIQSDTDGTYENSNPDIMAKACRQMAGWKLSNNGNNVSHPTPCIVTRQHLLISKLALTLLFFSSDF